MAFVEIKGEKVRLELPVSYSDLEDVRHAVQSDVEPHRILGGVLGLCWRGHSRPMVSRRKCATFAEYGGRVFDELRSRGITTRQLEAAAVVAQEMIVEALVSQEEVEEAKGFSEREKEGSSAA